MNINATIIGQSIAFAFFVWFCMEYVWPPIINALRERQKRVADGLAAAERGQNDLKQAQTKADEMLAEARQQAQGIIEQANRRAATIIEEAKGEARKEGERLIAMAHADIDQQVSQARTELRQQVAAIAVAGAGRVINKNLDNAANKELVEQFVAEL